MAEYVVQSGKDIDSVTENLKYGDRVIVEDGDFDSVDVKVSGITYEALNPRKAITGQWVWNRDVNSVKIDGFEAVHSNYNAFELNKNNKSNWITKCGIHTEGTCGIDIANNDYRLQTDSPCINAGDDGKNMGYWQGEVQPKPEPEPQPEPIPGYVEKSVLIEALQGMINKIRGV